MYPLHTAYYSVEFLNGSGSVVASNLGVAMENTAVTLGAVLGPSLTCDLNHDGTVNVLDVQLMTNQALGITSCTNDLTQTGTCSVLDVQRVVNAALGGSCRLGP